MFKKKSENQTTLGSQQRIQKVEKCQNCQKNGILTQSSQMIINFKEVIHFDFNCDSCGFKSSKIEFKEKLSSFGVQILFKSQHLQDNEREVIYSQNAKIRVEQIDYYINCSEKPLLTTIKNLIERALEELKQKKSNLKEGDQALAQDIENNISVAQRALQGKVFPLTIKIRDLSGNSKINNPDHPLPDKNTHTFYFERTVEQLIQIGYSRQQAEQEVKKAEQSKKGIKLNFNKPFQEQDFLNKQPVVFQVPCDTCLMPGWMKLCETSIPYFTNLVIMSFSCDHCGAHSVETKNSGQVPDQALEITLKVDTDQDLKRDLFKSQTCKVCIPEVELELDYGTLGGQYTTVEGLLQKVHYNLGGSNTLVDSDQQFSVGMKKFLQDLWDMRDGKKPFTLILIDPMSKSFLQNPYHPNEDKKAKRVSRQRSEEQQDFLGFTGMNVSNYK